jgi:putative membrane protein
VPDLFRFPLLHAGGVDPTGWLWSDWNIEPTIAIGLLALVTGYLVLASRARSASASVFPGHPSPPTRRPEGTRPSALGEGVLARFIPSEGRGVGDEDLEGDRVVTGRQKAAFIAGVVTIFVALGPPLDDWSDHYLLLAHMVQHLLLILLAAPLLLYGTPAWMLEPLTRNWVTNTLGYWLTRPLVAYALANTVIVLWHIPLLYDAALASQPVHVLEHMTLLASALLAWWPIAGPLSQWPRLPLALHSLYFFAMTLPGGAVGAFITFAEPGLYTPYDTARRIFGIDLATDQQAAGLLMWVAVSTIYLLLITISFFRWASREEAADASAPVGTHHAAATTVPSDRGARAAR